MTTADSPLEDVNEEALQRRILIELGRYPNVLVLDTSTVGQFYDKAVARSLAAALRPWGPAAIDAAISALKFHIVEVGHKGQPDLTLSVAGRFLPLELKRRGGTRRGRTFPPGELSDEQRDWHAAAKRRGVEVPLVRSVSEAVEAVHKVKGQ